MCIPVVSRLSSNYKLSALKAQIREKINLCTNSALVTYANAILSLDYVALAKQFLNVDGSLKPVFESVLPDGFSSLRQYFNLPGIYYFVTKVGKAYLGSTGNLFRRLYKEHKVRATSATNRHPKFYNYVLKHGWQSFNLMILALVPNHSAAFIIANPGTVLTDNDQSLLSLLTLYHLTLVEQFFLDLLNPTLNTEMLANASSPNLGGTGMVRSDEFKDTVSLSHQGRSYTEHTVELHRANMTGNIVSDETKAKMSESHGGVAVYVMSTTSLEVTTFNTKSAAAKALGVSLRTVSRWVEDSTRVYTTKNLGKVRVSLKEFASK